MPRVKDYESHILSVKEEIEKTKSKLNRLNGELDVLMKEKDEHDIGTLYKYIRENKIQMSDVLHTIGKEIDVPATSTTTPNSTAKSTKTNSTRKKSSTASKKATTSNSTGRVRKKKSAVQA